MGQAVHSIGSGYYKTLEKHRGESSYGNIATMPLYSASGEGACVIRWEDCTILISEPIEEQPTVHEFSVGDLPNIKLLTPIKVRAEIYEKEVIVTVPDLEIHLWGDDLNVLKEVYEAIETLYDQVNSWPSDKLGPRPKKWKAFFDKYVKK